MLMLVAASVVQRDQREKERKGEREHRLSAESESRRRRRWAKGESEEVAELDGYLSSSSFSRSCYSLLLQKDADGDAASSFFASHASAVH